MAELEAFPYIPGPQLARFDTKGKDLDIEFVRHLGAGIHAHVWKVVIDGTPYALKMVLYSVAYNNMETL